MIDVRIICTFDTLHWATDSLGRFLEAEQHRVRVCYGRQSLEELDDAKTAREAVIVVWSQDAVFSQYMLDWARSISPIRLVEIATTPRHPRIERMAPVLDFTTWRGDRPSDSRHVWRALLQRLEAVEYDTAPPKPPPMGASIVLSVASALAVVAAGAHRVADDGAPMVAETIEVTAPVVVTDSSVITPVQSTVALGGAVDVMEPASFEDLEVIAPIQAARTPLLQVTSPDLVELEPYAQPELPSRNLLTFIGDLNPLRGQGNDEDA
ncbi:MAG: hypothetical protein K2P58_08580 [Hyphomonadaceae bacterium]|nr:hypothetical protein [Hyphomonadaceae bacterium]